MWRRMRAIYAIRPPWSVEMIKGTNCVLTLEGPTVTNRSSRSFCRSQHWAVHTVALHVYYLDVNMAVRPRRSKIVGPLRVSEGSAWGLRRKWVWHGYGCLDQQFSWLSLYSSGKSRDNTSKWPATPPSRFLLVNSLIILTWEANWFQLLTWLMNTA